MTDIRHRQRMPDGSLHIRFSDRSDIGVYVCQVVSIGGNDSVTERLNVVGTQTTVVVLSGRGLECITLKLVQIKVEFPLMIFVDIYQKKLLYIECSCNRSFATADNNQPDAWHGV